MSVEDKGEVEVDDHNEWSDDEEHLEGTTWENWALILIGLALVVVLVIGVVAWVGFFSFFLGAHEVSPLLGEPAEALGEEDAVDQDVLVSEEVDDGDQWLDEAEELKIQPSVEVAISDVHENDWHEHGDLEESTGHVW